MSGNWKNPGFGAIIGNGVLLAASLMMLLPFLWMFMASLAPQGEIFSGSIFLKPDIAAARDNYAFALSSAPLLRYMLNGAFVCLAILVLQLMIAVPAGYALAKLSFRGRPILFAAAIIGLMIPIQVPAIPLYIAIANAGLTDTYTALILPFIISGFAIFLFRQFFATYPDDVIDAARLDGFSEFAIVFRLILPSALPAIAAFSIFSVVAHWNDLYWPLIVITRPEMMTPPLGLATFRASGDSAGNVGALMAGGVMTTLPLIILFGLAQKHFIGGLTIARSNSTMKT